MVGSSGPLHAATVEEGAPRAREHGDHGDRVRLQEHVEHARGRGNRIGQLGAPVTTITNTRRLRRCACVGVVPRTILRISSTGLDYTLGVTFTAVVSGGASLPSVAWAVRVHKTF